MAINVSSNLMIQLLNSCALIYISHIDFYDLDSSVVANCFGGTIFMQETGLFLL